MSYQVLARKWRPKNFGDMVGQEHVVRALKNALDDDRIHHAFLFTGTRGVGKTTIARILAKCLNCETGVTSSPCGGCGSCREIDEGRFVDLLEVDAASRSKVEETRELMENVQFAPTRGRYKVYLIDEVHMFSDKSFNALLKTLEEPPPHVKFLLATTDPQKLPITVLSRCLQFNLKRLPVDQIGGQLSMILKEEGIDTEDEAVRVISGAADGSMRDALSLLDQAIAFGAGKLETSEVRVMLGAFDAGRVSDLMEALAAGEPKAVMAAVDALAGDVADFGEALAEVLSFLQKIAMVQAIPDTLEETPEAGAIRALAESMAPEDVQLYYQIGLLGRRDLPLAPNLRGGFEMTLLRMLAFRPAGAAPGGLAGGAAPAAAGVGTKAATHGEPAVVSAAGAEGGSAAGRRDPVDIAQGDWPRLMASLPLTGLARELAANCALREAGADRIQLVLAPEHGQLLTSGVVKKLEEALRSVFGGRLRVAVEIERPPEDTPAKLRKREDENRRAEAVEAIEGNAVVQDLCKTFGTKVDPELVQPVSERKPGG